VAWSSVKQTAQSHTNHVTAITSRRRRAKAVVLRYRKRPRTRRRSLTEQRGETALRPPESCRKGTCSPPAFRRAIRHESVRAGRQPRQRGRAATARTPGTPQSWPAASRRPAPSHRVCAAPCSPSGPVSRISAAPQSPPGAPDQRLGPGQKHIALRRKAPRTRGRKLVRRVQHNVALTRRQENKPARRSERTNADSGQRKRIRQPLRLPVHHHESDQQKAEDRAVDTEQSDRSESPPDSWTYSPRDAPCIATPPPKTKPPPPAPPPDTATKSPPRNPGTAPAAPPSSESAHCRTSESHARSHAVRPGLHNRLMRRQREMHTFRKLPNSSPRTKPSSSKRKGGARLKYTFQPAAAFN
jgi:hypothetical protein